MTSLYRINYQLRSHKRDSLIEFIKALLLTPFVLHAKPASGDPQQDSEWSAAANRARYAEIMASVEVLIQEHITKEKEGLGKFSRLYRLVPSIGSFFTSLPLKEAFLSYDESSALSARRFVPPSFNDIRSEMVLDADGADFSHDSALVANLVALLRHDLFVAVVTAAGYGVTPYPYEKRLSGLLDGLRRADLTSDQLSRFYVLGGECNYLFQCSPQARLMYVPAEKFQPPEVLAWSQENLDKILDIAETSLTYCVKELRLPAEILRKARAVGVIPKAGAKLHREQLDECVLSTQQRLIKQQQRDGGINLPFCAFNGGNDVWVDIGNKQLGVSMLQNYLDASPSTTLHVGDQFLSTGNDYATRRTCCTLWIVDPEETRQALEQLLSRLPSNKAT